jgi:sulfate permease, SulP family
MTGSRHNSNRELIGQGIANIVTPMFGGIPATGAIARTATNIKNGAVSPVSGMMHSAVVLIVLVLFAPYASSIPLASMAPILMIVAWNMSERKAFLHILRTKSSDAVVLTITFLLTVMTDLTTAVEVGLVAAVLLFVRRMSKTMSVEKVLPDHSHKHAKVAAHMVNDGRDCPQIAIVTVEGPLFFGAANRLEQSIAKAIHNNPKLLLLRMGKVPIMDTTGEANLSNVIKSFQSAGGTILISNIQEQPLAMMKKTGLAARIGEEHFFAHTGEAIDYAIAHLHRPSCIGCKHYAFRECAKLSAAEVHYPPVSNPSTISHT